MSSMLKYWSWPPLLGIMSLSNLGFFVPTLPHLTFKTHIGGHQATNVQNKIAAKKIVELVKKIATKND